MRILARMLYLIERTGEWPGKVISFLILPIILFICFYVAIRYAITLLTQWADELAYLMCGTLGVTGGTYAPRNDNHFKTEISYNRLSNRGKSILDIITAPLSYGHTRYTVLINRFDAGCVHHGNCYPLAESCIQYLKGVRHDNK